MSPRTTRLKVLHDQGIFELGVVLKGGTSLRKLRAGNAGRFSTDLDFAIPDVDIAGLLLDTLDGAELFDVRFSLAERETLRAKLIVEPPLGNLRFRHASRFRPVACGCPPSSAPRSSYQSTLAMSSSSQRFRLRR
jgi:Nucleotidyl transferase AbiEii toxin, Type IV TA system